jgi:hypothetical protein
MVEIKCFDDLENKFSEVDQAAKDVLSMRVRNTKMSAHE